MHSRGPFNPPEALSSGNGVNSSKDRKVTPGRSAWAAMPVVSPVAASACGPMEIEALPRSPGGEKRSLPVVADLMETCIDDVLRAPAVPAVTAIEEPIQAAAYAGASVPAEDALSLAEAAARLKQLELESSPLLAAPRNNMNVNVAMNNQDDVVKLTEKCGLNSAGSSPCVTPLRTPEDLKSNILKAQAEAAALKGDLEEHAVMLGDKNCNLQEASASRPDVQDTWDLLKPPSSLVSSAGASAERLAEDLKPSVPKKSSESTSEAPAPKVKAEEVELQSAAPLSDNLIDFTDPTPVLPPVQPTKPVITPRWIVPTTAHCGSAASLRGWSQTQRSLDH